MFRRLFTLCSALSLLLCVAVGALWARGGYELVHGTYGRTPQLDASQSFSFSGSSYSATLRFEFTRQDFGPVYLHSLTSLEMKQFRAWYPTGMRWFMAGRKETLFLSVPSAGFRAGHWVDTSHRGYRYDNWVLAVPSWLPMVLLLLMPAVWVNRFRKTRRARRLGLCPACGYDLRATPERCPECSAVGTRPFSDHGVGSDQSRRGPSNKIGR